MSGTGGVWVRGSGSESRQRVARYQDVGVGGAPAFGRNNVGVVFRGHFVDYADEAFCPGVFVVGGFSPHCVCGGSPSCYGRPADQACILGTAGLAASYQRRLLVRVRLPIACTLRRWVCRIPPSTISKTRLRVRQSRQIERESQPRNLHIDRTERPYTPPPLERLVAEVGAVSEVEDCPPLLFRESGAGGVEAR